MKAAKHSACRRIQQMKRLLFTLAAALAVVASAWAENGYRAHFYFPSVLEQETGKPFVYHTVCIADNEAEVRGYIYGEDPAVVILGVEYLGVAETVPAEPE